jgi:hypothetical protein
MKFSVFYWTWKFITVFTAPHTAPLSWARWNQSTLSHTIFLWYIFILSFHLCLCFCYCIQFSCCDRHTSLYKTCDVCLEYIQSVTEWQLSQFVWYKRMLSTVVFWVVGLYTVTNVLEENITSIFRTEAVFLWNIGNHLHDKQHHNPEDHNWQLHHHETFHLN